MHGRYAVDGVELSSCREDVATVRAVAGDGEVVVLAVVGGHQDPTRVLQVDLG